MHRPTRSRASAKAAAAPAPVQASLTGIPPELRNAIYHLVAEDIKEVSIKACKISKSKKYQSSEAAADALWSAISKHPLSQTCRQIRAEFDPVHRHRALNTSGCWYYLELDNYDVERLRHFARLITSIPTFTQSLTAEADGLRRLPLELEYFHIRLHLHNGILDSLEQLKQRSTSAVKPNDDYLELLDVLFRLSTRLSPSPPQFNAKLYLKNNVMSQAQRRNAMTQRDESKALEELKSISPSLYPPEVYSIVEDFRWAHSDARAIRRAAKNREKKQKHDEKMKKRLAESLRQELR